MEMRPRILLETSGSAPKLQAMMGLRSDLGTVQSPIPETGSSPSGQEESIQKEAEWDTKLMNATKEIEELKANLMAKETELRSEKMENDLLAKQKSVLEIKMKAAEVDLANMKASVLDKENKIPSILKEENEAMKFEIEMVHDERNRIEEMQLELKAELRRLKVQLDQWRKAAETGADMLVESSETRHCHSVGGKLGSPFSDDLDDESPKKKSNNVFKMMCFFHCHV